MQVTINEKKVKMQLLPGRYAVSRLDSKSAIPGWADGEGFVSITRTSDELSIVCPESRVPEGILSDRGWTCLKFIGPFAFDEYGIVASVVAPISAAAMGVFLVSTYDGDHLLVKAEDYQKVKQILTGVGHTIYE
jgi:hypothetical protein